ncbi:AzlD domain-containing protein [Vibrio maerlii]|uniref:AzlD domain-containing protein n=1 Tax=Vibrio maerlii TaxID=2231648 RepID=UPI000E3BDACC|nr:AzlD domain-containing protein [Vibrio maerlii]
MDSSLWIAMAIIAIGTFLMRALPVVWMSRRIERSSKDQNVEGMPLWLSVLGPTMIAAMFGTSLIPSTPSLVSWIATVLGVVVTIGAWYWKRSLGIPVFAGVFAYGLTIYLGGSY